MSRTATISLRISPDLKARAEHAAALGPYPTSLTAMIERGLALAIDERERTAST